MIVEKIIPSKRLDEDKLHALQDLFPHVIADGKIDFDALREELAGETDDIELGDEHYALSWPGKRAARRLAAKPASGTLAPLARRRRR